jgi:hypothetical protein
MENSKLGIQFGALAPKISAQLKQQGFNFVPEKAKRFQELYEHITHLKFGDILTESEARKAQDKLFAKITKHVKEQNKILKVKK